MGLELFIGNKIDIVLIKKRDALASRFYFTATFF